MYAYFFKRILWIFPTLFGVLLLNFIIIQTAPGGPIDQIIAQMQNTNTSQEFLTAQNQEIEMRLGYQGLDEETIEKLNKEFGFDQPLIRRFFNTVKKYILFDFGTSYFKGKPVLELVKSKFPVSLSLGLWSTFFIFLLAIPLGILKAIKHDTTFDLISTGMIGITFAVPSFLIGLGLLVLFSGGSCFDLFPIRGIISDNFDELTFIGKIKDYFWHITLPIMSVVLGSFAKPTILTKNAFIEEMQKNYVLTARAKGAGELYIILRHCFKNALLVVLSSIPHIFLAIFFYQALLVEVLFSFDGIGYLNYEAVLNRDYPIIFANLYVFTLMGIALHILGDILYTLVDPRINLSQSRK